MDTGRLFHMNTYAAKAEKDLLSARAIMEAQVGMPYVVTFLCQQAIEKYFKQLLLQDGYKDLERRQMLLPLASTVGYPVSRDERFILSDLSSFYLERYPTEGDEPPEESTWEDAKDAVRVATNVQSWVLQIIAQRSATIVSGLKKMNLS